MKPTKLLSNNSWGQLLCCATALWLVNLTTTTAQIPTYHFVEQSFPFFRLRFVPDHIRMVDLNNNGINDAWVSEETVVAPGVTQMMVVHYENRGTATQPDWHRLPAQSDAFSSLGLSRDPAFVDIDGDGDLDLFASNRYDTSTTDRGVYFYENLGTPTRFVQQTGPLNPLDTSHRVAGNLQVVQQAMASMASFVDVDGDGDMDCFLMIKRENRRFWSPLNARKRILFYKNEGQFNAPDFRLQADADNPLADLAYDFYLNGTRIGHNFHFQDVDQDGDQDLTYITNLGEIFLIENEGDAQRPDFKRPLQNPYAMLNSSQIPDIRIISVGQMGGNALPDVLGLDSLNNLRYFENTRINSTQRLPQQLSLRCHPNPADQQVWITLEQPAKQPEQWMLFNVAGCPTGPHSNGHHPISSVH